MRFFKDSSHRNIVAGVAAAALCAAAATYFLTASYYKSIIAEFRPIYVTQSTYPFVDPLLGISSPENALQTLGGLRAKIQTTIAKEPPNAATRYAVYFRDLQSSAWMGINQNETFDPASLLKVVVAIATFHQMEDKPSYGAQILTYTSALDQINQGLPFAEPTVLTVGQSYPIHTLIKLELADSDNGAVYTLLNGLSDQELNSTYAGLGIPEPNATSSVGYKISPLDYARFLRILWNGTYDMTWHDTNEILQDLSESTFTSGLVAGVPTSTPVAHKYGEHISTTNGQAASIELSDCGIVYYPGRPYLLCVMTEGHDQNALADFIAHISKTVYQEVENNYH